MSLSARRAWIEIEVENGFAGVLFVALRKESVDRNHTMQVVIVIVETVALRKESVDRNDRTMSVLNGLKPSLSARRAWIEISIDDLEPSSTRRSLSARRAWIEILYGFGWEV